MGGGVRGIRSDRRGRTGRGVLPSDALALMAQTALTFHHSAGLVLVLVLFFLNFFRGVVGW